MEKIKAVMIDDSYELCRAIKDYFAHSSTYEMVGFAHDAQAGIDIITARQPDIILLDMVMPKTDGMYVLRSLRRMDSSIKRPKILVLSAIAKDTSSAMWISEGADYVLAKETSLENIELHMDLITDSAKYMTEHTPTFSANKSFDLEKEVTSIIQEIGIPANIKGYNYIREAIILTINNSNIINAVTKELYPHIAKTNNTKPSRVERAIRHAIEVAWDRGDSDKLNSIFGYTINVNRGKPTNSEFIAMIADNMRLEMKAM